MLKSIEVGILNNKLKNFIYEIKNRGKSVETCLSETIYTIHKPVPYGTGKPLRILYAAYEFEYNKPSLGFCYEENNFFHSLYNMGHELIRFDFGQLRRKYGLKMMSRMLLETVFRYDPDILFFVIVNDKIDAKVLQEITNYTRTVTINFNADDQWRFDDFTRYWAPHFNWNITTSQEAISKYATINYDNVIYSQYACNHYLYRPMPVPKIYDVSFIGQPHGIRREFVDALRRANIKVDVWGAGWGHGRVSLQDMVRIYNQSKINLNISAASVSGVLQVKGRDFEVPGTGNFMLTGYSEELTQYYEMDKEIITYRNVDEAVEKIRYYLVHEEEREIIAQAALCKTLSMHTYEQRFNEIFRRIEKPY